MFNESDTKLLQALHVLITLVQQAIAQGNSSPVASKPIAQALGMSPRAVEPLLVKMAQANIIKSVRGVKGGYVLARERRRILLSDVYTAVVPLAVVAVPAVLQQPVQAAQQAYLTALSAYSLEDMVRQSQFAQPPRADFSI